MGTGIRRGISLRRGRRRFCRGSADQKRRLLTAEKDHEREDGDSDRNRHRFPVGLSSPFLFSLPDFEALPLVLFLVERSGGLDETMDGVFFIKPQRTRIGPDEATGEHLIRKFGEVALFQRFDEVRSNSRLGSHLVDGKSLGFPNLFEKFSDRFHASLFTASAVPEFHSPPRRSRRSCPEPSLWSAPPSPVVQTPACNRRVPAPVVKEPEAH